MTPSRERCVGLLVPGDVCVPERLPLSDLNLLASKYHSLHYVSYACETAPPEQRPPIAKAPTQCHTFACCPCIQLCLI